MSVISYIPSTLEVRKGKHNSKEYVLGTKDVGEKYIESQEEDHRSQPAKSLHKLKV
ncbi:MAG: hypothetical protein ACJ703_03055 [Nitrososphaera sp.]